MGTTARRLVRQTTAQERQSATQARTASAPTVRPTQTAPQGRCAATDSVQSHAIHLLLHLLHLPQPQQLQNQQPLTHPVLRSAAQTMIVKRVSSARTVNARSLARMMPTAMVPMKSAIPPTTTASTVLQTISVKMVALVTQTAGRTCPAAVLPTAAPRSATQP